MIRLGERGATMAVTHFINASDMARLLVDAVQDEPAAKELWFRQIGLHSNFWLVIDTPDLEVERQLRRAGRLLYRTFRGALIDVQVINRAYLGPSGISSLVPADAHHRPIN
jgi:hypothetical protein